MFYFSSKNKKKRKKKIQNDEKTNQNKFTIKEPKIAMESGRVEYSRIIIA